MLNIPTTKNGGFNLKFVRHMTKKYSQYITYTHIAAQSFGNFGQMVECLFTN